MPAPTLTPPKPVCRCRACGSIMDAQYQAGLLPGRDGYFYVTCWNVDCWMQKFTFTNLSYGAVDLNQYRRSS